MYSYMLRKDHNTALLFNLLAYLYTLHFSGLGRKETVPMIMRKIDSRY